MSYDLNKVFISGNLTDDPKIYEFGNGEKAANFSIAINKTWTGENGEQNKKTTYVDCRASGKHMQKKIEAISKYLKRGRKVLVEGSLELNKYKKNDQSFSKMRVILDEFHFMDSKNFDDSDSDSLCVGSDEVENDFEKSNDDSEMYPILDPDYDKIS